MAGGDRRGLTYWQAVRLVAGREIRERLRSKVFRIATLISALIVGGIIVMPNLASSSTTVYDVGLVGKATPHWPTPWSGRAAPSVARSSPFLCRLWPRPRSCCATASSTSRWSTAHPSWWTNRSTPIGSAGDCGWSSRYPRRRGCTQRSSRPGCRPRTPRRRWRSAVAGTRARRARPLEGDQITVFIGVVILFIFFQQYGSWILVGVAEEKSSRIAEVLLGALRPRQLVAGKIFGIGAVGFMQAAIVASTAMVASRVVGTDVVSGADPASVLGAVGWFVLGFGFYGWAFAAAGSLVSRQSEAQAAGFPISIPLFVGYIAATTSLGSASRRRSSGCWPTSRRPRRCACRC